MGCGDVDGVARKFVEAEVADLREAGFGPLVDEEAGGMAEFEALEEATLSREEDDFSFLCRGARLRADLKLFRRGLELDFRFLETGLSKHGTLVFRDFVEPTNPAPFSFL